MKTSSCICTVFSQTLALSIWIAATFSAGCIQKEVDKVGAWVSDARQDIRTESRKWITESDEWQTIAVKWNQTIESIFAADGENVHQLKAHLSGLIQESKEAADEVSANFHQDTKLTLKYANALMVRNLDAALAVLAEHRDDVDLPIERIKQLINERIKQIPLDPDIGRADPDSLIVDWITPDMKKGFTFRKDNISVYGFGFNREDFNKHFRGTLVGFDDKATQDVTDWIEVLGQYELNLQVRESDLAKVPKAKYLKLEWAKDGKRFNLITIPLRWYRAPDVQAERFVKVQWKYDGSAIVNFEPASSWDFGIAPGQVWISDLQNKRREIEPGATLDFNKLGIRNEEIKITLVWLGEEIEGTKTVEIAIQHERRPRGVAGYEAEFTKLVCVKQQENSPDEPVLTLFIDGQKRLGPTIKEGVTTGTEWALDIKAPVSTDISATLTEDDDPPFDPHDHLGSHQVSIDTMKTTNNGSIRFSMDDAIYDLYWRLNVVHSE